MPNKYKFFPMTGLGKILVLIGVICSIFTSYFYINNFIDWVKSEHILDNSRVDSALAKATLVIITSFWILMMLAIFILPLLLIKKRLTLLIVAEFWLLFALIPLTLMVWNIAIRNFKVDFLILNIVTAGWIFSIIVGSILIVISTSKLALGSQISFLGKVIAE